MALLATLADFVRLGLPATALVPPPREIESVDVNTGRILTKGHGLIDGDLVKFEAQGVLPAPLIPTTLYTVAIVDLDIFTISVNGSPVVLTTTGTRPYAWRVDPRPVYEQALLSASGIVQDHATAHGEITSGTEQTKLVTCVLAAGIVSQTNRLRLPLTKDFIDELRAKVADTWITLRTWQSGKPIAGLKDSTPAISEMGAVTGSPANPSGGFGWGCGL